MARVVLGARRDRDGNRYHYCPMDGSKVSLNQCQSVCKHFIDSDNLKNYRVHCDAGEDTGLVQVKPPSAASVEGDPLALLSHRVIEPKLDGARIILHVGTNRNRATTRRKDKFGKYSEVTDNLPHLRDLDLAYWQGTILDGEIISEQVANGSTGSLGATMSIIGSTPANAVEKQNQFGYVHYHVFDMPFYRGQDNRSLSFRERRDYMRTWFYRSPKEVKKYIHLARSYRVQGIVDAKRLHQKFMDEGLEGSIIKDPDAPYGGRLAWIKVKEYHTLDVQVIGFKYGSKQGKYEDKVGSLRVAVLDRRGDEPMGELVEVATVSPGDDVLRDELTELLVGLSEDEIIGLGLILEIGFQCWTKNYRLRHPRVDRYRPDRSEPNTLILSKVRRR